MFYKTLCRQESVKWKPTQTPMPTPTGSTPKTICEVGRHNNLHYGEEWGNVLWLPHGGNTKFRNILTSVERKHLTSSAFTERLKAMVFKMIVLPTVTLTLLALQTKTNTYTNSVDPVEMTGYELSSGSTLFAILLLFYTGTPICNDWHVHIQGQNCSHQKLRDEKVNFLPYPKLCVFIVSLFTVLTGAISRLCSVICGASLTSF